MKTQYAWLLPFLLLTGSATGATPTRIQIGKRASQTTELARQLLLQRLEWIAGMKACRQAFVREKIDLDQVRAITYKVRFYNAEGPEGELRFSDVVCQRRLRPMGRSGISPAGCLRTRLSLDIRTAASTSEQKK